MVYLVETAKFLDVQMQQFALPRSLKAAHGFGWREPIKPVHAPGFQGVSDGLSRKSEKSGYLQRRQMQLP
ncbi:hypothetical protein [Roseibium algae]|uniref:Uncharacterized protein n=1 Tax=Roseibium algae TaxID=3123038 RepID=A0ABU8TPA0_9HYPH